VLAASTTTRESGAIYNIGTGTQTSVGDLVQLARESLHISAEPVWGSALRESGIRTSGLLDPRKVSVQPLAGGRARRPPVRFRPNGDVAAFETPAVVGSLQGRSS